MVLTRRRILAGLSTAVAGGALGCSPLRRPAAAPAAGAAAAGGPPAFDCDVCVVGSGFAGTYLALALVEAGVETVVVEAGPRLGSSDGREGGDRRDGAQDLFPIESSGGRPYPVTASRSIAVGGTSHKWTGVVSRLLPTDFRVRSDFGFGADWPIGYDDLDRHYCAAERLLGTVGPRPLPDAEPPRDCPFPVELPEYLSPEPFFLDRRLAFSPLPMSRPAGPQGGPVRLDEVEIPRLVASPLATLVADRPAARLVLGTDGRSIDRVELAGPGRRRTALRARCYVVAAGVFESARLLLASTSPGTPAGLGNGADLVGRYFGEHPTFRATWPRPPGLGLPEGVHRTYSLNDELRRRGLDAGQFQVQAYESVVRIEFQPSIELRPENRFTLEGPEPPRGPQRGPARLVFDFSDRDRATIAAGVEIQNELARALALRPESARRTELYRYHPAGTCRMGFDASDGVVDRDLKVFGTENLYVSGASVFPATGTANPTVTVVALTLRLAGQLRDRLSSGEL